MRTARVTARRIRWMSDGAASAVAAMLDIKAHGVAAGPVVNCSTGSEDEDNKRFRHDCEPHFGCDVTVIRSEKYESTWDVWERRSYMAGIDGAVCTGELKVVPRLNFTTPWDINVFGYTADKLDRARADRLREAYPDLLVETPLIEEGMTKADCRGLLEALGIKEPRTYAMGFPNANCLQSGCCKSSSPDYWALHRKCFPEGFAETCRIARKLGVRLVIIGREKGENGKVRNIRCFPDEIPTDWPILKPTAPRCDMLCAILQQDLDSPTGVPIA